MVPDHRAQLPMDPAAIAVIHDAQRFGIIPACAEHQFGFRIGDESGRNHGRMTSPNVRQEKVRAISGSPTRERGKTSSGVARHKDLQAEFGYPSSLADASGYQCK